MSLGAKLGCMGLAAFATPAALAQASVSTGSEYSTGGYGETADTTMLYAAVSAGYAGDDWSLDATLPWVELDGPATFLGIDAPLTRGARPAGTSQKVSGMADLALSLTRTFKLSSDGARRFDLTGRVQLPTGDQDQGLSTGQTRYSLGVDLSQDLGDWTLFIGGGWRINGEGYEDGAFGSSGLAWTSASGMSAGAAYDYSDAATMGVEAASEVSAWLSVPVTKAVRVQVYGVAGFSEGSPDQAFGARLVFGG